MYHVRRCVSTDQHTCHLRATTHHTRPRPTTCAAGGLRAMQAGQLSAVVWSLAAMGQARSDAFRLAWAEVRRRGPALAAQKHHLVQIWQAALASRLEGGGDADISSGDSSGSGAGQGAQDAPAAAGAQEEGLSRLLAAAEAAFVGEAAALKGQVRDGAAGFPGPTQLCALALFNCGARFSWLYWVLPSALRPLSPRFHLGLHVRFHPP